MALSNYFTWQEALWLPHWNRSADLDDGLTDEIKANIIKTALVHDQIRDIIGASIIVHSWYRPPSYSIEVGGTASDVHTQGLAVDWHTTGMTCAEAMTKLEPLLDQLNIRMERNTTDWIHTDCKELIPGHQRYFYA